MSESQKEPPDWQDFVGIVVLLLINSTISFFEENNAGNAAAALMARLAPKAKVGRLLACCHVVWRSGYVVAVAPPPRWSCLLAAAAAAGSLSSCLSLQVLRDGEWKEVEAQILVPGDIISIKLGDIVPADARLLEGDPLKIDQVRQG